MYFICTGQQGGSSDGLESPLSYKELRTHQNEDINMPCVEFVKSNKINIEVNIKSYFVDL